MPSKLSHALTLSTTNSYGIVALCSCGWASAVHPSHRSVLGDGRHGRRRYDQAEQSAIAEHARHARAERPLTATLAPEQFVGAVLNTSRFGHA